MKNEIIPTVQAVAEIMPPRKNGFFEKSMEVAHLLLDHEPVSIIARTVDSAIQNYGMIKEMKYRAKAFKYAAHLEEVRINANIELAKIQNVSSAINICIDKSFQKSLDQMEAWYLMQSNSIDQSKRQMIQEVNNRVQAHLKNIDKRYVNTVRENEMKCAMYRDFLHQSEKEGVTQMDITLFIARKLAENMNHYNSKAVISVCDVLKEMLRKNPTISFEEYLGLGKKLKRL